MDIDSETIDHVFASHRLNTEQAARCEALRAWARRFAFQIVSLCPPSQERTLALHDVQRAAMMAIASIGINENEP